MNDNESAAVPTLTIRPPSALPLQIVVEGLGELAPADDMTPKEAVQLCMVLAGAMTRAPVDVLGFLTTNGLDRHFRAPPSGDAQ